MCRCFCDTLERAGYFAGIYMSADPLETLLTPEVRKRYALWVAEYGGRLSYSGYVGMWQNSSSGRLNGIVGSVDTDLCYEDYPTIIKKAHLNGYKRRDKKKKHKKVFGSSPFPQKGLAGSYSIELARLSTGRAPAGQGQSPCGVVLNRANSIEYRQRPIRRRR